MATGNIEPRDLVLAIVAYNEGGRIQGRTFLQKLSYFLNEKLKLGFEFEPHYYGPFSESVAMATNTLVGLGFLKEIEEHFPAAPTSLFEPRRYTYELTSGGKTILGELERQQGHLLNRIRKTMGDITAKEECNYECLSLAAKMFHILKSQGKPMTEPALSDAAKDLGWKLEKVDIDRAANFLKELGLIREVPKEKALKEQNTNSKSASR